MKEKSRVQQRVEEYMKMENLLTEDEAKELVMVDHLKYLKNLFHGLVEQYGEEEGEIIFELMLPESSEYWEIFTDFINYNKLQTKDIDLSDFGQNEKVKSNSK